MQTLARLFERSPFSPLQAHMEKVASCVKHINPLLEALKNNDYALIAELAKEISKLEHEADLTKNDIRNNLPSRLFLPITISNLLEILSLQDTIADSIENVAVLLTFRKLEIESSFRDNFFEFVQKNIQTFDAVHDIVRELSALMESSFGGKEAEKVIRMVEGVALKEHECDIVQRKLLKIVFQECDSMPSPSFFLWMKIIQELASLSDESEKLANRIRMILKVNIV